MKCPYCGMDNNRVYAHAGKSENSKWFELVERYNTESVVRRRRVCLSCDKKFVTVEVYDGKDK